MGESLVPDEYREALKEELDRSLKITKQLMRWQRKCHYVESPVDPEELARFEKWQATVEDLLKEGESNEWFTIDDEGYGGGIVYLPPIPKREVVWDETIEEWRARQREMAGGSNTVTFHVKKRDES